MSGTAARIGAQECSSVKLTLATIIATVGPSSESPEMVRRLIGAGVGVFRLNFSHGALAEHARRVAVIRAAAKELGKPTAIMGDLQGPKIRVGTVPAEGIQVRDGQDVVIDCGAASAVRGGSGGSGGAVLPCTYAGLSEDVNPGDRVLINDGAIRMVAVEPAPGDPDRAVRCRVQGGGLVTSGKGINLPDSDVRAHAITEKDWECVEWAVEQGLDFLALSFVRRAEEVRALRKRLSGMCPVDHAHDSAGVGSMIPVIAKIEKPQALVEIDAIVQAADAIMVARGDLGVEMELAQVPVVQKRLIAAARDWGKPCIVATQMLETMITSQTPTRAEVSDVANAVFDGADAVMLSGETAVGQHPVLVVQTMRRIVEAAEERVSETTTAPSPPTRVIQTRYRTAALAHGAWYVARDLGAKLVVCWSQRGGTARYLSQMGLHVPIIAYSSDERELRRMALLRGVTPLHAEPPPPDGEGPLAEWNRRVDEELVLRGWACAGDPVVLLAGRPLGRQGATTSLAVHYVGNPMTGFRAHGPGAVVEAVV